ncbi:PHD finger protein 3 [Geranomyces variabilis]|nr:PHD finger protein 3 [Geranomyces variabilis]
MNGDLADLTTADLLNLEAMDWDAPSVLDVGNHHNPVDLSNPLLTSDLMTELSAPAANDNSALAWHSEHGLLDDLNALASTDMFPSHSGRNADQQEENIIEDAPQGSQSGGSQASKEHTISNAPVEDAHDGDHGNAGGEASENEPQTPKGMMVTATPVVERRATREKAHVNYKALLDGPSISRKLVPPKKSAHNDKGQRVYCTCRQPDKGNFMIQCDNCEEWFHGSCVGLTKKVGEKLTTFHCEACKELLGLPTTQPSTTPTATKSAGQTAAKQPRRHSIGRTAHAAAAASKASPSATAASPATQRTPQARSKGRKLDMKPQPPAILTKCLHVNCSNPPGTDSSAKPGFCSSACYDAERHRLTNLAAELAASAISSPKSPTYPPKKCEHGPCTNARAAGSVFCGAACVAWCPPDPKMVAMLAASGEVQAPRLPQPPPPVALDKYRQNALNGFVTTFEKIFQEARDTPAIYGLDVPPVPGEEDEGQRVNLNDVKAFCTKLESALFDSWSSVRKGDKNNTKEVGEPYKAKYRSLQFNLKDVENVRLRRDVLKGTTTPAELVNLSSEELGNDAVRATIEAVRRKSLRDSVRAAEHHEQSGTGFVKKTHKGEVEVVPVGAEDNDAVWGAHPVSMFGGWQDRDIVESPRTPLSALSEKREGGAEDDEPKAKKVKFDSVDDNAENTMDGVSHGAVAAEHAAGDEADGSTASAPMQVAGGHAIGEETPEVEEPSTDLVLEGDAAADHYGYEEYEPIDARAQTPPGSPPLPAESIDPTAPIWTGRVHMPVVGRFQGRAIQTHGLLIGTARTWEDLLPATVTIDGRVPPSAVETYLEQSRTVGGRQVVAVRFEPAESEEDRAGYATVFEYFASRTRAAVIGHHYVSIKDMYILPVAAGAVIPAFIAGLGGLGDAEGMQTAERDSLFGVIILCKGFGSPAVHQQSPIRDRKREQHPPHHLQQRQPSPPPQSATDIRLSTPIPSLPAPPFPAAGTPSHTLPAFPAAAPSLLDAFAGPLNPNAGVGGTAASTASMLSSLLANPANAGMLSGLLAQLGGGNPPGGAPPVDFAALLSTLQGTNLPLSGMAPAPAAPPPAPGIDARMHPSRAAHAMMQDPPDQYHAGRQQDGPPGKKTRWG